MYLGTALTNRLVEPTLYRIGKATEITHVVELMEGMN